MKTQLELAKVLCLKIILFLPVLLLSMNAHAATVMDSKMTPPDVSMPSTSCPPFVATYLGTEMPGANINAPFHDNRPGANPNAPQGFPAGLAAPPGVNSFASGTQRGGCNPYSVCNASAMGATTQLDWTPAGPNTTNYIRQFVVPCTGNYQIFFTLTLQAALNPGAGGMTVTPTVNASNPTQTIFPGAGGPSSFIFNPNCMVSSTPTRPFAATGGYCSVVTYYFVVQANLVKGQIVKPPNVAFNGYLNVVAGEFYAYLLPAPPTPP